MESDRRFFGLFRLLETEVSCASEFLHLKGGIYVYIDEESPRYLSLSLKSWICFENKALRKNN